MFGTVSGDTIFGYAGSGDSPAYTRSGLLGLNVTTYVSGPGGLLAIDMGGRRPTRSSTRTATWWGSRCGLALHSQSPDG